jgi:hypothetical protein
MTTITPAKTWDPARQASRPADITENIHRWIAWIYGIVGSFIVLLMALGHQMSAAAIVVAVMGAIVGLHAALAAGARRRSSVAKVGSFIVGLLMLAGFPIGTITGGFLIYNAVQPWPPRHIDAVGTGGPDMRDL